MNGEAQRRRIAGRFDIQEHVTSGGMGSLHRARDTLSGKYVALKLLREQSHSDGERFSRECRTLAELNHPGIVRHIDHGVSESGELYLAMEWLQGVDLAAHLSTVHMLAVSDTLRLGLQLSQALAEAHAHGVVHRDIKPSNIWLMDGSLHRIKILDFGVARTSDAPADLTHTGVAIGTPGYMAPEQARGELNVDARADLFSLGCVLYECLAGVPAFTGDHVVAVLAKVLLQEAPSVRETRKEVSREVEQLVAGLLSKEPKGRPASALDVANSLSNFERAADHLEFSRSTFPPALTRTEQRFVSVVVGAPLPRSPTGTKSGLYDADLGRLKQAVASFGARVDIVADGSVVALVSGRGVASELVSRSARCALALCKALPSFRISLCTGRGITGDRVPIGEALDRAFDMLTKGQLGKIAVDDVTASLLDIHRFELHMRDEQRWLKGQRETAHVKRTLLGRPTECLGRERELSVLEAIFNSTVQEPSAAAVLLTAGSGVGKTRVRQEFISRVRERPMAITSLVCRGDSLTAGSPFGMLAPGIRRLLGVIEGESLEVQRHKLRSRIGRVVADDKAPQVIEFLGELAGVPFPDDYSIQLRSARSHAMLMGDRMRMAWETWLRAECRLRPVALILEDLHWGDLPTVEFVAAALRALSEQPLLVIGVGHPQVHERFPRIWQDCDVTELRMRGVSRKASRSIARSVLGDAFDSAAIDRIVERAAGNVFYLEELIRALDRGEGGSLPETVFGMVQSRLDALDLEARRVLRAASVYGLSFNAAGISALLGGEEVAVDVEQTLTSLVEGELLLRRQGDEGMHNADYAFRSELLREAAYATLTDEDRVLGHRLAGEWLKHAGRPDAAVLAEHLERGHELEQAVVYYHRAAKDALEGNDLDASILCAQRGAACAVDGPELGKLRLVEAEALRWKDQLQDAEDAALSALQILEEGTPTWFDTLGELLVLAGLTGREDHLNRWLKLLATAIPSEREAVGPQIVAQARAAWQLIAAGRYQEASASLGDADALSLSSQERSPLVDARLNRVRAFWSLTRGDLQSSLEQLMVAEDRFSQAGDLRNECLERVTRAYIYLELGQHDKAAELLREALAASQHMQLGYIVAYARSNLGLALGRQSELERARVSLERAIDWFVERGGRRLEGGARIYLAEVLALMQRLGEAEEEAERAVALLDVFLPRRAHAYAMLAHVRLLASKNQAAMDAAGHAQHLLEKLGRLTEGEGRVRLSHAEALRTVGDVVGAKSALHVAYESVMNRASCIRDASLRQGFLRDVPVNFRTLRLASEWGVLSSAYVPQQPTIRSHPRPIPHM